MKKSRLLLPVISIALIIVAVFFISPMEDTNAQYKSAATGNDEFKTATWDVSLNQDGIDNNVSLISDGSTTQSYTLNVKSLSQVDTEYSIVIDDLPDGVKVSLDDGEYQTTSNGKVTFSNVGIIRGTDDVKEKSYVLTFKAEIGTSDVSDQEVNIDVKFRQKIND